MTFEEARAQFPVLERYAYLNAGTNGPVPRASADAIVEQTRLDLERGRSGTAWFERILALREEARLGLAAMIDADPLLVALTDSTSRGCSIVLSGLELRPEDEVVITDQEHFGLTAAVFASGVRVVMADEATEDGLLAAVTPRTRLIATSHVLWTTGRCLDLKRVREDSGVPVLVDGAQSAGAIPVTAGDFDFYTVSAQKWLCAPEPSGALFVRDPERLRIAAPGYLAQTSYEPTGAFVAKDGAPRFDNGWLATPILLGLNAALAARPDWCFERAAEQAARCSELLADRVEVVTPPGHSTLVSFRPNGDPTELVTQLDEQGVIVRELPGRNLVRASCAWWTNEDDLQRLAAGVSTSA
jgi:L-cysteine/cystine lyase